MNLGIVIKKYRVIVSIIINVALLIVHLFVGKLFFATNDDRFFADILSGAYGLDYRDYIVFSNIIYGYILKFLYIVFPSVSWYVLVSIILSVISFSAFTFLLIDSLPLRRAFAYIFLLLPILTYYHYVCFQWTQNAYLYSVIGIILMVYAVEKRNGNKKIILLGIILGIFGFLIRQECFISVLPVMTCGIIIKMMFGEKNVYQKRYLIAAMGILLSLCTISFVFHKYIYTKDEGWRVYSEFNVYRAKILDYGGIEYDKYASELDEIGIDKIDADLFNNWVFADNEKYSLDRLHQIDDIQDRRYTPWDSVKELIKIIRRDYLLLLSVLLTVGIVWVISAPKKWKYSVFPMLILLAECLFLCFMGRIVSRIIYGMLLMECGILLQGIYAENNYKYGKKFETVLFAAGMLAAFFVVIKDGEIKKQHQINEDFNRLAYYINAQKDNIFFMDVLEFSNLYKLGMDAMEVLPVGFCDNVFLMGGWDTFSPRTQEILNEYEIMNPMKELADENHLVCDTEEGIDQKITYLNKDYGYNIEKKVLYRVDDLRNVYILDYISREGE